LCDDYNTCKYILKIIFENKRQSENSIKNELKITQIVSDNKISPMLIKHWECLGLVDSIDRRLYFVILEKMDLSLKDYVKKYLVNKDKLQSQILDLISKLHRLNIVHGDIHMGNIMVNLNGDKSIKEMKLIDFGDAELNPDKSRLDNELNIVQFKKKSKLWLDFQDI
jgi:serine/threonine protein kinase